MYYQYDSSGQRVRKATVNTAASLTESRLYVASWEVYRRKNSAGTITLERETLHLSDDTGRVALIDTRTIGTGAEPVQLMRYQLSNHLSTATLELDDAGEVISYEEYYPYGSTSFLNGVRAGSKRYRYTGKERDEESGFYYHGARYYAPWLCRWIAADPLESKYAEMSPYNYGFNNPVKWTDSTGMEPDNEVQVGFNSGKGTEQQPVAMNGVVVSAKRGNSAGNAGVTKPEQLGVPASDNTSVYTNSLNYSTIQAPQDKYTPASIPTMGPDMVPPEVRAMYRRERAYNEMQEQNRTLDPLAYDLARSPGVQAGMALVVPGYGEAAGAAQMYSGFKTGNKADVILGGLSVGLGGYSSLRGVLNEGRFIKPGSLNAANGTFRNEIPSQAKSTAGEIAGAGNLAKEVPTLRAAYVKEVEGLSSLASKMKAEGNSTEEIARVLHGLRRELGVKYKSLTPDDMLQKIYQRNIQKYGDKLGPTIDYLRQQGKSWDDIINSAIRTGGKDLGF